MTRRNHRSSTGDGRATWVDVAKGLAIVMVVTHHSVMTLDGLDLLPSAVTYVNYSFAAFRMPLLFLASGLFAGGVIERPWRVVLHRRTAHFAYLHLVWALVYFAVFSLVPRSVAPRPDGVLELMSWLWEPRTSLWFIYGLALGALAVKAIGRWPLWIQVLLSVVLSVLAETAVFEDVGFAWQSICAYFVFFLVGVRFSRPIRGSASRSAPPGVVVCGLLALSSLVVTALLDLHDAPGTDLVRAAAFTVFLIGACVLVDGSRAAGGLRWLGERTLPVYLLHPLWIAVVTAPLIGRSTPVWSGPAEVGVLALLVVTSVAVSWGVARGLQACRAGWLFALPTAWRWRERSAPRHAAAIRAAGAH